MVQLLLYFSASSQCNFVDQMVREGARSKCVPFKFYNPPSFLFYHLLQISRSLSLFAMWSTIAPEQHHEDPQYKVPPPVEIEGSPTGYFVHYQDGSEGRGRHPHYHPHHHPDNQRSSQLTTLQAIKMVPIDLKGGKGWAAESKPQITWSRFWYQPTPLLESVLKGENARILIWDPYTGVALFSVSLEIKH